MCLCVHACMPVCVLAKYQFCKLPHVLSQIWRKGKWNMKIWGAFTFVPTIWFVFEHVSDTEEIDNKFRKKNRWFHNACNKEQEEGIYVVYIYILYNTHSHTRIYIYLFIYNTHTHTFFNKKRKKEKNRKGSWFNWFSLNTADMQHHELHICQRGVFCQ